MIWPASLPQRVLADDYHETQPETVQRSTMDSGPPKARRRFTAGVGRLQVSLRMTPAQLAVFEAFVRDDLGGGALPFDWVHPRTQAAAILRIVPPWHASPRKRGAAWHVRLELEVLP